MQPAQPQSLMVSPHPTQASVVRAYAKLAAALHASAPQSPTFDVATDVAAVLYDPHPLGFASEGFALPAAASSDDAPATPALPRSAEAKAPEISPSPPQRLAARPKRNATPADGARARRNVAATAEHEPTIFEKLFGKPAPVALAYAADNDGIGDLRATRWGRYDRWTAVYDISAHTVYMPDGSVLEAHSGLGSRMDDPRYAEEKMRGATPPALYDLQLREGLFHGVRALRLIPSGNSKVFGRTGLLAHTYMLGPNGQSNGCVSFRDYRTFLQAYLHGDIKRLAVVSRID